MTKILLCFLLMGGVFGMRNSLEDEELLITEQAEKGTSVVAMQWSSHWQCWIGKNQGCADAVLDLLPQFLHDYDVDFVDLGMFQLKNEEGKMVDGLPPGVPDRYSSYDLQCSRDNIKILYNSEKWEVLPTAILQLAPDVDRDLELGEANMVNMYGCFGLNGEEQPDRVYGIFPFKHKATSVKVIVVFSHFPHPPGGSSSSDISVTADKHVTLKNQLGRKINLLKDATGAKKVLIIADLNLDMPLLDKAEKFPEKQSEAPALFVNEPAMSSEEVWATMEIDGSPSLVSATEYELTCCSDKTKKMSNGTSFAPAGMPKFVFAFDRVLANWGKMTTISPLDSDDVMAKYHTSSEDCPMYVGAFHKPIIGAINR